MSFKEERSRLHSFFVISLITKWLSAEKNIAAPDLPPPLSEEEVVLVSLEWLEGFMLCCNLFEIEM